MAATLAARHGGSALLRRTQQQAGAFLGQQRRLFFNKPSTPEAIADASARVARVQEKKEELYDMIFDLVGDYDVPGKIRRSNELLLQRLSVQVEPRHNDLYWRSCRRMERCNGFLTKVGTCTVGVFAAFGVHWLRTEVRVKRRTWVDDVEDWFNGRG